MVPELFITLLRQVKVTYSNSDRRGGFDTFLSLITKSLRQIILAATDLVLTRETILNCYVDIGFSC